MKIFKYLLFILFIIGFNFMFYESFTLRLIGVILFCFTSIINSIILFVIED